MNGQELIDLYVQLFGVEPFRLTTVDIENPLYKEMIAYCNISGTPLNDKIIAKFFGNKYDVVYDESSFSRFKKPN